MATDPGAETTMNHEGDDAPMTRITELSSDSVQAWAEKAETLARPILHLPHAPRVDRVVELPPPDGPGAAPHGAWMLTWPDLEPQRARIHRLADGGAFLDLLEHAYQPVLTAKPRLRTVLQNGARLELSVTNDVLQVQLRQSERYSMIRHHALMLFEATLWLEPASRYTWGELCSAVADLVMADRSAPPSTTELDDIEADGLTAVRASLADGRPSAEIARSDEFAAFRTYQLWATAAIGALWREFASRDAPSEMQWHDAQFERYLDQDYLSRTLRSWL